MSLLRNEVYTPPRSVGVAGYQARMRRNPYDVMTPEKIMSLPEVEQPEGYAQYLQRELGIPWPTQQDMIVLRKKIKEFFEQYPHATYYSLCRIADWCKVKKRRYERVWMVPAQYRSAWAAGYLSELSEDSDDDAVERAISRALEIEDRPGWRQRLLCTVGRAARREALAEWEKSSI